MELESVRENEIAQTQKYQELMKCVMEKGNQELKDFAKKLESAN